MAESIALIYLVGALLTALNTNKLTHFHRCVLLWPIFWVYLLLVILEMAVKEVRGND
ncbi:hypothetical protein [Pseudomonas oryzihabitans]|uniref:hypothetical protein n=1 Tax=Pseudomonas oryzihabitans TaxID=47885 RepID=UPI0028A7E7E7|nr:hypothetical protein [Pseudomonas oryzihabitans]